MVSCNSVPYNPKEAEATWIELEIPEAIEKEAVAAIKGLIKVYKKNLNKK